MRTAYENYYLAQLRATVTLGTEDVTLETLFAGDEYGRAVLCDRAVHRGVGHAISVFRAAARRTGARSASDAPAVLECVREMEKHDAARLDAINRTIHRGPGVQRGSLSSNADSSGAELPAPNVQ